MGSAGDEKQRHTSECRRSQRRSAESACGERCRRTVLIAIAEGAASIRFAQRSTTSERRSSAFIVALAAQMVDGHDLALAA